MHRVSFLRSIETNELYFAHVLNGVRHIWNKINEAFIYSCNMGLRDVMVVSEKFLSSMSLKGEFPPIFQQSQNHAKGLLAEDGRIYIIFEGKRVVTVSAKETLELYDTRDDIHNLPSYLFNVQMISPREELSEYFQDHRFVRSSSARTIYLLRCRKKEAVKSASVVHAFGCDLTKDVGVVEDNYFLDIIESGDDLNEHNEISCS